MVRNSFHITEYPIVISVYGSAYTVWEPGKKEMARRPEVFAPFGADYGLKRQTQRELEHARAAADGAGDIEEVSRELDLERPLRGQKLESLRQVASRFV